MRNHKRFAGNSRRAVVLFSALYILLSPLVSAQTNQQNKKQDPEEEAAKKEAIAALTLLHENQIRSLYRDKISDLQKSTGLTSEAKAMAAFGPTAQMEPGLPRERTLIFEQRTETLPIFFNAKKGDFYSFVFLSKYPSGDVQEEVYMVKEKSDWKVAAIAARNTF